MNYSDRMLTRLQDVFTTPLQWVSANMIRNHPAIGRELLANELIVGQAVVIGRRDFDVAVVIVSSVEFFQVRFLFCGDSSLSLALRRTNDRLYSAKNHRFHTFEFRRP